VYHLSLSKIRYYHKDIFQIYLRIVFPQMVKKENQMPYYPPNIVALAVPQQPELIPSCPLGCVSDPIAVDVSVR